MSEILRLSEDQLCQIWQWQRFLDGAALVTTDSIPVHIVYQGWRSGGAGPDFRDAIVSDGNSPLRHGPVEVHLRTSGWHAHHHDTDPHYTGLALHVVWEHDGSKTDTVDGSVVPTVALRPILESRLEEILSALSLHMPIPPHGDFPCPGKYAGDDVALLWTRLASLGEQRFLARADLLESEMVVHGPEQTWYAAVLEALGYQRNVEACRAHARVVPYSVLRALWAGGKGTDGDRWAHHSGVIATTDRATKSTGVVATTQKAMPQPGPHGGEHGTRMRMEAVLLGAAGLLPQQRTRAIALQAPDIAYCASATRSWLADRVWCADDPMTWDQWVLAGVRPSSHPARRAAAMATIVAPVIATGLAEWLRTILLAPHAASILAMPVQNVESYWSCSFDFGRPSVPAPQALVGTERAIVVAINATLPSAVALARLVGDQALFDAALATFHDMPAPGQHQISRQMLWHILDRPASPRRSSVEQGLLHAYRQWCQRKRCWDCPVSAMNRGT